MNLDRRVRQLEDAQSGATQGRAAVTERRARLEPHLASPRFDGHREAILAALCEGETRSYTLRLDPDPLEAGWWSVIFLDWSARDSGGEPSVTRFTLPLPEQPPVEPE